LALSAANARPICCPSEEQIPQRLCFPRMYEWFTKDRPNEVERKRQVDDVRAWCIIGAVALATFLVVWLPLLVMTFHS
jgi:hypothetical protein